VRTKPWVLIVIEDDLECSRERLAAALSTRFPDVDVMGTGDGDEAMRLVASPSLALLVTVEESRGIDGLVLAAFGRRVDPGLPVVLLSDARPETALGPTGVERLPRKVPFLRLVEHVARVLDPSIGFSGELTVPSFLELVRVLSAAHASGALVVRHGGSTATLWFELGSVVHAVAAGRVGVEAFHHMMRWKGGAFTFAPGAPPSRSIAMSVELLLRECNRFLDQERGLARGSSPGLSTVAASHFRRALALMRSGRHADALEELHQASHLDVGNRTYRAHLERLRDHLGLSKR
jgi:hypothetical protein